MGGADPESSNGYPVPNHENPYRSEFGKDGHLTALGEELRRERLARAREPLGGPGSYGPSYGYAGGYGTNSRYVGFFDDLKGLFLSGVVITALAYFFGDMVFPDWGRTMAIMFGALAIVASIVGYILKKLWWVFLLGALAYGAYLYLAPSSGTTPQSAPVQGTR